MTGKVFVKRTVNPNSPPPSLEEGELGVEMNVPTRLWVGVPRTLDITGKKLLADSSEFGKYVAKTGDVMSGTLTITNTQPLLALNILNNGMSGIINYRNSVPRWVINMTANNEGGGNSGSDLFFQRYSDAGAFLGNDLWIIRATGHVGIAQWPSAANDVTHKAYVDQLFGSIAPNPDVSGYVHRAGDHMTGNLSSDASISAVNLTAVGGTVSGVNGSFSGTIFTTAMAASGNISYDYGTSNNINNNGMVTTSYATVNIDLGVGRNVVVAGSIRTDQGDVYVNNAAGQSSVWFYTNNVPQSAIFEYAQTATTRIRQFINGQPVSDPNNDFFVDWTCKVLCGVGQYDRQGSLAVAPATTCHNFAWTGANMECWSDAGNLGNVTFSSDYRIKKDVAELPNTWDRVKALRPIKYTHKEFNVATPKLTVPEGVDYTPPPVLFKADNIERWGFIAHELQQTLIASAATGEKDAPDIVQSPNPWTVIAALTKALQEAMTRIEQLEARVAQPRR